MQTTNREQVISWKLPNILVGNNGQSTIAAKRALRYLALARYSQFPPAKHSNRNYLVCGSWQGISEWSEGCYVVICYEDKRCKSSSGAGRSLPVALAETRWPRWLTREPFFHPVSGPHLTQFSRKVSWAIIGTVFGDGGGYPKPKPHPARSCFRFSVRSVGPFALLWVCPFGIASKNGRTDGGWLLFFTSFPSPSP